MEITTPGINERLGDYQYPQLAPIEFAIIGASPHVRGRSVNVNDLLQRARDGDKEALRELLTPVAIQGEKDEAYPFVIQNRNDQQAKKKSRGATVIDADVQVALAREKREVFVALNDLDSVGKVMPEWKIFIMQGDNVDGDQGSLSRLKLGVGDKPTSPDKVFRLDFPQGEDHAVLTLNLEKAK